MAESFSIEKLESEINKTTIKKLFLNWLNTVILKDEEDLYCYQLKELPSYICFYLNRTNTNTMVDIMKNIKFFKNSNPTQNYIKYKIHAIACYDGEKYYSILNTYSNHNKWIMFTENKIPSLEYISMSDDDIIEKIKKESVFIIYTLN